MYAKSILKILVIGLLASGCSDVAEKFRNQYNPSRAVVDQGGSNVISTGNACALNDRDAKEDAEKTAEREIRSERAKRAKANKQQLMDELKELSVGFKDGSIK